MQCIVAGMVSNKETIEDVKFQFLILESPADWYRKSGNEHVKSIVAALSQNGKSKPERTPSTGRRDDESTRATQALQVVYHRCLWQISSPHPHHDLPNLIYKDLEHRDFGRPEKQ